jgi:hypothetical protein
MTKPKTVVTDVTVTKTGITTTLTGTGTLTYKVGTNPQGIRHYCITGSSGGGHYSSEWVAAPAIEAALQKASPITSNLLRPLFKGKSANNSGYLLAVLLHEKVVERLPEKAKHYALAGKQVPTNAPTAKKEEPGKVPAKAPAKAQPPKKAPTSKAKA